MSREGFMKVIYPGGIGGKGIGIERVRQILEEKDYFGYTGRIDVPETHVLGTEAFLNFIRENNLEELVERIEENPSNREEAAEVRKRIREGTLPEGVVHVIDELVESTDKPLAVRSSSRLEDGVEHPFAGIYYSGFAGKRNTEERKLQVYKNVKEVFASVIGEAALSLRERRGISEREEMAVLLQPVVGDAYNDYFFPLIAGVIFTRNYHLWNRRLKTGDGFVRMVMGLGTRAVGRGYARMFDPAQPTVSPVADSDKRKYAQEVIDVVSLNSVPSPEIEGVSEKRLGELINETRIPDANLLLSAVKDNGVYQLATNMLDRNGQYIITLDGLLRRREFTTLLNRLIEGVDKGFGERFGISGGVDMEFAASLNDGLKLYIVQARPLVHRAGMAACTPPRNLESVVLTLGPIMTNGCVRGIRHVVYVDADEYSNLDREERFRVARVIGKINQLFGGKGEGFILLGPGRWGTNNYELGIPVRYSEINNASAIVEYSSGRFSGEFSYGTHFFQDLEGDGVAVLTHAEPVREKTNGFSSLKELSHYPNLFDRIASAAGINMGKSIYARIRRAIKVVSFDTPLALSMNADEGKGILYSPSNF